MHQFLSANLGWLVGVAPTIVVKAVLGFLPALSSIPQPMATPFVRLERRTRSRGPTAADTRADAAGSTSSPDATVHVETIVELGLFSGAECSTTFGPRAFANPCKEFAAKLDSPERLCDDD